MAQSQSNGIYVVEIKISIKICTGFKAHILKVMSFLDVQPRIREIEIKDVG